MTYRIQIPKPQDREAWLEAREPYFNASAAAVLFDRHPFMSVADYATEKLTGEDVKDETSAMRRGRFMEDAVAQWWAHEQGVTVYEPDVLFVADRFMATVDRIVMSTDRPVEIKTASGHHPDPEQYWLDQCQAIMWCAGADHLELVWVDASLDLFHVTLDADPDIQAELVKRSEKFMAAIDFGMVPDWVQPTLTASHIDRLTDEIDEDPVDLGEAGLVALERYNDLKERIKEDEEEVKAIRDDIARMLGEHDTGLYLGEPIVTWRRNKPSIKLDVKRLADEHPDLVAEYQYEQPGARVLRPKK